MMHRSLSLRTHLRSTSLLCLGSWLSLPLGLGVLTLNQRAQAIDLESPAITETAPISPAAPPVDTFIDPPEPAWEPAPVAPPVPSIPEPIALPETPVQAAPTAPAISPQVMPQVADRPAIAPTNTGSSTYSITHDPVPVETTSTPTSHKTVLSGSISGCKASLNIDPVLAATLCGPAIQTAQKPTIPIRQYTPVASAPTYSTYSYQPPQQPAPKWTGYSPSYIPKTAPTPWVKGAPVSLSPLAKTSPSIKRLSSSPNPLKWLVPNRQQMIFPLPMPASITSAFGWRTHPISGQTSFHAGTDLAAPTGTPVLATFPGQVQTTGFMGGYGLAILLQHQDGQLATRYAHLSKIYVQPGQWISQGTIIGLVGSTGNSTGPHLHFETLKRQNKRMVAFDSGIQLKVSLAELIKAMQTAKVPPKPQS